MGHEDGKKFTGRGAGLGTFLAEGTAGVQVLRGKELGTLGLLDGGPEHQGSKQARKRH